VGPCTDILLVAFLLLQTWVGWRSGLLWQVTGLATLGLGLALGTVLAPSLGSRLKPILGCDTFPAEVVAFLFVAGLVGVTLRMLASWAEQHSENNVPKPEREQRRADDRILGGIFGALKGLVLALVLVVAGVSLWPKSSAWQDSRLAPPMATAGARLLPEGAIDEVRTWVATKGGKLRRDLDIQTANESTSGD